MCVKVVEKVVVNDDLSASDFCCLLRCVYRQTQYRLVLSACWPLIFH